MIFTVEASQLWLREWPNYLAKQRAGVEAFLGIYLVEGLDDQTCFPGRLSPSWHSLPPNDPQHIHAQGASLWHYHIGYPAYAGGYQGPPAWGQTSDDLLHFQWLGSHIKLIEISAHHVSGRFHVPAQASLSAPAAAASSSSEPDALG